MARTANLDTIRIKCLHSIYIKVERVGTSIQPGVAMSNGT